MRDQYRVVMMKRIFSFLAEKIFDCLGEILEDLEPEIDYSDTDTPKFIPPRINSVDRLIIPVR